MQVYLADDGTYKNTWSHRTLIPTEEQLGWFAMLDAAANERGVAKLMDDKFECSRTESLTLAGKRYTHYIIKGTGKYIGDKEC